MGSKSIISLAKEIEWLEQDAVLEQGACGIITVRGDGYVQEGKWQPACFVPELLQLAQKEAFLFWGNLQS